MAVTVEPVTTKTGLKRFIRFPWKIYRGKKRRYENWVPPLLIGEKELFDTEKHPFYKHADIGNFMAYRNGKEIGRISAIIDRNFVEFHNEKTGFFGFFECEDDKEAACALFDEAEKWVKAKGMQRIIGPMNPSTNHILGVLIDSFDEPPMVQMNYNPPYYQNLYEKCGFSKERDLYCYRLSRETLKISDKIRRVTELSMKRNKLTVRSMDMKNFDEEVERIRELYNSAWERNWGFVPWTREEFDLMADELKLIARPELVLMIFAEENLVGLSIPLPNINEILIKMNGRLFPFGMLRLLLGRKKTRLLRVAIMGVHPEYHNKGIDAVFALETYERGENLGFEGADFSWVLEDNLALRNMLEGWGTERYRTYRVYGKDL